jgi:integrase
MTKLTAKKIAKLVRAGEPGKHTDSEVKGLMLCIEGKTSAHGLLRYQRDHKVRHMGLGSVRIPEVRARGDRTWPEIRVAAQEARRQLLDGIDPLALRASKRAEKAELAKRRLSFKETALRCHEAHSPGWSSARTADEFLSSLERWAFPLIGNMDVAEIGRDHVMRVLEQKHPKLKGVSFWIARTQTADRTRNRIEKVLDWASARGFRPDDAPNPASWRFLENLLPAPRKVAPVRNLRSLAYPEVPQLMIKLAADETVAAACARFVILSACRLGEALGATWAEIEGDTWVIPAERMKARKEHRVPLSPQVMALLNELPREDGNPFLFVSSKTPGKAITEMTVTATLRRNDCSATTHGMRSSFSTWAHERSSFSNHVIELSLAHSVGSAVERAYRRTNLDEQRRRLMQQWGRFATTPVAAKGSVVAIRRKA